MVEIKKLRLYLETTVFNYYFDMEREGYSDTVKLFEAIGIQEYDAYTSAYVTYELQKALEPKRGNMLALIEKFGINMLNYDRNTEAVRLANIYLQEKIIPKRFRIDSTHLAMASVHEIDCVISYNFLLHHNAKTSNFEDFETGKIQLFIPACSQPLLYCVLLAFPIIKSTLLNRILSNLKCRYCVLSIILARNIRLAYYPCAILSC